MAWNLNQLSNGLGFKVQGLKFRGLGFRDIDEQRGSTSRRKIAVPRRPRVLLHS